MTPEQLAAIAQFLGCEATPEAVLAALQQLISQLQAAPEPAADGTGGDPAAMTMMSNIGGAMGLPATAGKSEVIAKLNDIVTILKAPPTKKLDFAALKRFVAGVEASLEEPEEDDIPYFTGDDNSDDDDAPVRYSSGRSNGQGKRDRQVGFRHARGAAKPGLIDVVAAITQLQAGPVQFEMPAFKSKRTSPKAALRSMNINNASNGGWRLNRELSGELLEALYAELVFEKLGVKVVPMDGIESLTMNRVQSGAVAYWAGTGQTVTDANAKLQAAVTLQTKELISKAIIENKLLNNSVGTEAMVQEDILKVMKLRLELAGLYGTGSVPLAAGNTGAEPLGLKSITGVTSTSLASKSPTIDDMINAEGRIEDANYDYTDLKWLSSGRARRYFKKMKDTKGLPLFDEDWMTTDIKALMVNDHPFLTTTQVPNTTVDSVVTTDIFLADWNAMLLGQGLDLDMVVDTSRYVEERSTLIQVVSYADFGLAYKEAIQILTLAKV